MLRSMTSPRSKRFWKHGKIVLGSAVFGAVGWACIFKTTPCVSFLLNVAQTLSLETYLCKYISSAASRYGGVDVSFSIASSRGIVDSNEIQLFDIEICGPTFSFSISEASLGLSLWNFINGNSFLSTCVLRGMTGVLGQSTETGDAASFAIEAPIEIENASLVTRLSTNQFGIRIYRASLPRLRSRWLLLDILHATNAVGVYDESLFYYGKLGDQTRTLRIERVPIFHFVPDPNVYRGHVDISVVVDLETPFPNLTVDLMLRNIRARNPRHSLLLKFLNDSTQSIPLSLNLVTNSEDYDNVWNPYASPLSPRLSSAVVGALYRLATHKSATLSLPFHFPLLNLFPQ